jgi:hypothetical protein
LLSAAIVVLPAPAWWGVTARAQSLADVARQEEERRKTVKPVGKVLTNKDLGASLPPTAAPPPPDATKVPEAAKTEKAPEAAPPQDKTPVRDQAYWSMRIKDLRTQLERDQIFAEALQTRVNSLTADFVNRDDPVQRAAIERDRLRALGEIERLKKVIEAGNKAIADLEEEARRAGVPPGWLR